MSPLTGPDLVGAGYPIGNSLNALLGGQMNATQSNVPVCTNLYFGLGNLQDALVGGSVQGASVNTVAVPVLPGTVITKMSLVAGATTISASVVSNNWAALYTGTGSLPGTTGAQPALIAQSACISGASVAANALSTYTFSTPQTITSVQAPYGYIYASWCVTQSGSPTGTLVSMTSATAASVHNLYPATSPFALFMTSNGGAASVAPANLGLAAPAANPPVVLLY